MLIAGVPIAVGLFALAEPIVRVVYGPSFVETVPALRALAPGLLILYVNSILMVTLVAVHRERWMVVLAALCCVLNLVLNLALIPLFAHVAAAAVKTVTELFICGFLLAVLPRELFQRRQLVVLGKAGLSGVMMLLVLAALVAQPLPLQIAAAAAVYVSVGLAVRLVPLNDLRALYRAVAPIKQPAAALQIRET
jgi:O-antigen/teichoic acid export membrane protein